MGASIGRLVNSSTEESEAVPSRIIQTKYGPIVGKRIITEGDHQVDAFLGVSFAKPPIGELRFKKPQPPEPWMEVKKTDQFGCRSIQPNPLWLRCIDKGLHVELSEDCLFLNVFTPVWSPSTNELFPVLVHVHGGGFHLESAVRSGDISIAKYLVRHGVIIVTIQYRLGPLGFFSTGDEVCPGNLGLWDMTFALQWVKDNIAAFGGDNNRVTVFGNSAGAASVDMLALSPHSRDLFQQVIPMGGSADCDWAISRKCLKASRKLAKKLDCQSDDSAAIIDCLRRKSANSFLVHMYNGFYHYNPDKMGVTFGPVMDGDFFPRSIAELRREAPKKKWMFGTSEFEGLGFCMMGRQSIEGIDKIVEKLIPQEKFTNFSELREAARLRYLDEEKNFANKKLVIRAHIELYGNWWINNAVYSAARSMQSLGNDVYMYSFDYFNPKIFGLFRHAFPFYAATHGVDFIYLFGHSAYFPFKFSAEDYQMVDIITKFFTNFAKYGDPNGAGDDTTNETKWKPITSLNDDQYLSMNLQLTSMKEYYCKGNPKFWASLSTPSSTTK